MNNAPKLDFTINEISLSMNSPTANLPVQWFLKLTLTCKPHYTEGLYTFADNFFAGRYQTKFFIDFTINEISLSMNSPTANITVQWFLKLTLTCKPHY